MRMRRVITAVSSFSLIAGGLVAFAVPNAGATATHVCSGTFKAPGHLVGSFGNVSVRGACAVDSGPAHVNGDLTVTPGSALVAAFAKNDHGSGNSSLSVDGDVMVQSGAAAVIGCDPQSSPCVDDPSQSHPTLSSHDTIGHNLISNEGLGVVVHNTAVGIDIIQTGGGGGFNCNPQGVFNLFKSPVFTTFEDMTVGGNIRIRGVNTCWGGIARVHVAGDVVVQSNKYADPDAIEILSNVIGGNLSCQNNSMTWDNGDLSNNLFPRQPEPNTVHGRRSGQCVLSSPNTAKDKPGPGAF